MRIRIHFWQSRRRELSARLLLALETKQPGELLHDPIEDLPQYKEDLEAAEQEAQAKLRHVRPFPGSCLLLWGTKQRILQKKYGICWFSPAEMNPTVHFG